MCFLTKYNYFISTIQIAKSGAGEISDSKFEIETIQSRHEFLSRKKLLVILPPQIIIEFLKLQSVLEQNYNVIIVTFHFFRIEKNTTRVTKLSRNCKVCYNANYDR